MLLPDRHIIATDINFVCNMVADSGMLMAYNVAGSGTSTDDTRVGSVIVGPANASGVQCAGLLVNPFVTFNPLLHRNWYKVTQWPGEKATLLREGWVTTNIMVSGITPTAGQKAYFGNNGAPTNVNAGGNQNIGEWQSQLDENGFARLWVRLP